MASEVKYAVTEFAWPGSTGNFDVTIAALGWTPKAVKVTLMGGSTHESVSSDAELSVGFSDGVSQRVCAGFDDNARPSLHTKRSSSTSNIVIYHYVGGNSKISSVTAIADGWRFNASSSTGSGIKCIVEFFGGADLSANVHTFQPNVTGTKTKTGLAFQPDLLFFTGVGSNATEVNSGGHNIFSYGCAYDGGAIEQGGLLIELGVDNVSTQVSVAKLTSTDVAGQVHNGSETWRGKISAFTSDGYTFSVSSGSTGSDYVFCLALDIGDRKATVKEINAPTNAAVDWDITGIGFKPQGISFIVGMMEAADVNALKTDQKAGYLSQGFSDGARMYAGSSTVEDSAGTSNAARVAANKSAYLLDTSDAELFDIGLPTFESDGWSVAAADVNTVQTSQRKWLAFAIEEEGAGAGAELAGDATGQATAAGAATTGIPIAGAMLSVATGNGVISTSVDMEAIASAISVTDGDIDTEIRVSVAAIAQALAQAGLDVQTLFEAAAAGQADASGALSGEGAALSGAANALADANATITVAITMQGDALVVALAQAGLTAPGSGLEGHASGEASGGGAISTDIALLGNSSAIVTAQGGIDTILQLQGVAASASNMLGGLTAQVQLNAQAFIQALAQAGLTTADGGLSGDAGAVADANAWLKIGVSFEGDAVGVAAAVGALADTLTGFIDGNEDIFTLPASGYCWPIASNGYVWPVDRAH